MTSLLLAQTEAWGQKATRQVQDTTSKTLHLLSQKFAYSLAPWIIFNTLSQLRLVFTFDIFTFLYFD